jgi:hypothetical protein
MRSRRLWWARNGAFVRGMATGAMLALAAVWLADLVLGRL